MRGSVAVFADSVGTLRDFSRAKWSLLHHDWHRRGEHRTANRLLLVVGLVLATVVVYLDLWPLLT